MTVPTPDQITKRLKRVVELCQPGHEEGHGQLRGPCNLQLAITRADQYAGVLRSPVGSEGGRPSTVSNPTMAQCFAALAAGHAPPEDGDVKPPPYDVDQRLHDATKAVVVDCWWLLVHTIPAQPAMKPATVAMLCRSVTDRLGTDEQCALHEYAALVRHASDLVALVVEVCATDRTQIGRRSQITDCRACTRPVAATSKDPMRYGYCDACRKAWERAGKPDRAAFERDRPNYVPKDDTPATVHVDPSQHGMVIG